MFWRNRHARRALLICAIAVPAALAPGTAFGQAPNRVNCLISNPAKAPPFCKVTLGPNITVFCGQEVTPGQFGSGHQFLGCRVRAGAVSADCGRENFQQSDTNFRATEVLGCVLMIGAERIFVGCESEDSDSGSGDTFTGTSCGVDPVAGCSYFSASGIDGRRSGVTCDGVLAVRCSESFEHNRCDLVVGPTASPVFTCRIDLASPDATLASVNACVLGLASRRS